METSKGPEGQEFTEKSTNQSVGKGVLAKISTAVMPTKVSARPQRSIIRSRSIRPIKVVGKALPTENEVSE